MVIRFSRMPPMPLMSTDVESELSYAYLHAVVANAGYECALSGRHSDNAGVDLVFTRVADSAAT